MQVSGKSDLQIEREWQEHDYSFRAPERTEAGLYYCHRKAGLWLETLRSRKAIGADGILFQKQA